MVINFIEIAKILVKTDKLIDNNLILSVDASNYYKIKIIALK